MHETSERLLALLRGQSVAQPPLWDPWFAMARLLRDRFNNDYLQMAEQLGHAAIPVGIVRVAIDFFDAHRIALGEPLNGQRWAHARQHADEPDPYWQVQQAEAIAGRKACHVAGRACWMTMRWCFHAVSGTLGLENFALACYDNPDLMRDAMTWVEQRNRAAITHLVANVKPDFVLFEAQCAHATGPMMDPAMIRELCYEPTGRTINLLHEHNLPAVFHTEGKLDPVMDLILDLGFDAIHGCDPHANNLADLIARYNNRITLAGNMNLGTLITATPDQITQATHNMLRIGATHRRFIASVNTVLQDDVPAENYLAFCKAVSDYSV